MGDLGEDSAQRKLNLSYPFLLTNKVEKRIASCFLSWFTLGYNRNWANKFFQFCRSCNLKNVKCEWKITDHNLPSFFSYFSFLSKRVRYAVKCKRFLTSSYSYRWPRLSSFNWNSIGFPIKFLRTMLLYQVSQMFWVHQNYCENVLNAHKISLSLCLNSHQTLPSEMSKDIFWNHF